MAHHFKSSTHACLPESALYIGQPLMIAVSVSLVERVLEPNVT